MKLVVIGLIILFLACPTAYTCMVEGPRGDTYSIQREETEEPGLELGNLCEIYPDVYAKTPSVYLNCGTMSYHFTREEE